MKLLGGGRRRARSVLSAAPLQVVLFLLLPLGVAAASLPPVLPSPPPVPLNNPTVPGLGNQPGNAAAPCAFLPLGATEVRQVFSLPSEGPGVLGSTFGIDPAAPCHVFRSLPGRIDRKDGSRNWVQMYTDNSSQSPFSRGASALSPVYATGGGPLYFYDMKGNNGVFFSPDDGGTFDQRNTGLYTGTGPTGGVGGFAVAPSNPDVVYLAASFGGQWLVYSSGDGGRQWQLAGQPGAQLTSLAVDPADPIHVVAAGGGPTTVQGTAGQDTFFESIDGGHNWTTLPGPPGELSPVEMYVGGGRVLYAKTGRPGNSLPGISSQKFWRRDPVNGWHEIVIPKGLGLDTSFAFNYGNPKEMLIAAPAQSGVAFAATLDGFVSTRYTNVIPTQNQVQAVEMRADRFGDFFVQAKGSGTDQLFALRATALAPNASNGQPNPANTVTASISCPLAPSPTGKYPSSAIAFDGAWIDYTHDQESPGVIYRTNPRTCAQGPPIRMTAADFGGGGLLALHSLTFDSRYVFDDGHVGAILARGGTGRQHDPRVADPYAAAVYAVDPAGGPAELAATQDCGISFGPDTCDLHDPNLLNYDHYLDALWSAVPAASADSSPVWGLTRLPAHKGEPLVSVPTCMTAYRLPQDTGSQNMAMFEPGADGILYVGVDDTDDTVLRVDSRTCQTLDSFGHEKYSEGYNENDQMACDAITFGEGAPDTPAGTGYSVLWMRDSVKNVARAYEIPHGFCPFPTDMHMEQPPTAARPGEVKTFCAILAATTAGAHTPLAGQTIQFTFAGKPVASATTDAAGRACATFAIPSGNGSFQVMASFSGTPAYLPVSAASVLRVSDDAGPPHQPPQPPGAPVHVPPPQLAPVIAPPPVAPATQVQAQAQAQPQAQAQAQAQGQPGLMTERQKQARVALQRIDGARHLMDVEAARYQAAMYAQGVGLAFFGVGLYLRHRRNRRLRVRPARVSRR